MQYIYFVLVKDGDTTRNISIRYINVYVFRYASITYLNIFRLILWNE